MPTYRHYANQFEGNDQGNWLECIKLRTAKEQERFVAPNLFAITQSKFYSDWEPLCILPTTKWWGSSCTGVDPEDGNMWISRLMIDEKEQGKVTAPIPSRHGVVSPQRLPTGVRCSDTHRRVSEQDAVEVTLAENSWHSQGRPDPRLPSRRDGSRASVQGWTVARPSRESTFARAPA